MESNRSQEPEPASAVSQPVNLETAAKLVTAFAVALYGCGLLITSISYSRYGFLDMNPLRPRPVIAGAWFVCFCALSFALLKGCSGLAEDLRKEPLSLSVLSRVALSFLIGCGVLTSIVSFLFESASGTKSVFDWKFYLASLVLFAALVVVRNGKILRGVVAVPTLLFVFYVSAIVVREMLSIDKFSADSTFIWFSVGCLLTQFIQATLASPRIDSWPLAIFLLLLGLFAFAQYYYPHIKASWGGGVPIPVVIYTTKDAPNSGGVISAQLIEDSDPGLYILVQNDQKATFLPRSAVTMIYFSNTAPTFLAAPARIKQ